MSHEVVEKKVGLLAVLVLSLVSIGGLAEIVPLFFLTAPPGVGSTVEPVQGLQPYDALRLEGRDIYLREGCGQCHTQMVRPLQAETERFGHYSLAGESVYDHPSLWGSKRTGPDLAQIGSRYSDFWNREHLRNPEAVVHGSVMPAYPWLARTVLDGALTTTKMRTMNTLITLTCATCATYSEKQIEEGPAKVRGSTEEEALIAYLNGDPDQPGGLGQLSTPVR